MPGARASAPAVVGCVLDALAPASGQLPVSTPASAVRLDWQDFYTAHLGSAESMLKLSRPAAACGTHSTPEFSPKFQG